MYYRTKKKCEVCSCCINEIIHKHHIIPRTDPRSTDNDSNLAYLCPSCHSKVHVGQIIIEGVFLTTTGFRLFWHKSGEEHIVREGIFLLTDGTADIRG